VNEPSTIVYAVLGLLALRSWTGYELTQQVRRSLRLIWPSSEAGIYREQQHLVRLGWAEVTTEQVGRRSRKRYTITPAGRQALQAWLATDPAPPSMGIEGIVRLWLADSGTPADLVRSLHSTADASRRAIDQMLDMLQAILASDDPFPTRTQINVLSGELVSDLLATLERRCRQIADEVEHWETTTDRTLDDATRERIHRILSERA
jgi:PadR family transcriptional regulator, regulatory protein AphA